MVRLLLTYLALICSFFCLAQQEIPVNKYDTITSYDINNRFTGNDPKLNHFRIISAYSQMDFLNTDKSPAYKHMESNHRYGFLVGFEVFFRYFKFGGRYTQDVFELNNLNLLPTQPNRSREYTVVGGEGLFDFMLMPQVKYVSLFAGGGFSFQSIEGLNNNEAEPIKIQEPIWNIGIDLFLGRGFKFFGEYVQTFDNDSENAYNRLNGGFGFTF